MALTCLVDFPALLFNPPIRMIVDMIKRFIMSTHCHNEVGALLNCRVHARNIEWRVRLHLVVEASVKAEQDRRIEPAIVPQHAVSMGKLGVFGATRSEQRCQRRHQPLEQLQARGVPQDGQLFVAKQCEKLRGVKD